MVNNKYKKTEEPKIKIGLDNSLSSINSWVKRKEKYGKSGCKNPEERKIKISVNTRMALNKPEIKEKIILDRKKRKAKLGYVNSPETRIKLSNNMKEKWKNGEITKAQIDNCKKIFEKGKKTQFKKGHSVPQDWRNAVKKNRSKQIFPMKDTSIELKIQDFLTALKIEFVTHKYMNIKNAYQCDIFIPVQKGITQKIIIECDGDFFHCNPEKYSPDFKCFKSSITAKEKWKLDESRTQELIQKGFKVWRIWENKINKMELNHFKNKLKEKTDGRL